MEITNLVRDYAASGMQQMSDKFNKEGSELYKEEYVYKAAVSSE